MKKYVMIWLEMLGRFIIFNIGLYIIPSLSFETTNEIGKICVIFVLFIWMFLPLKDIKITKRVKER